jgi:hypothetical protein
MGGIQMTTIVLAVFGALLLLAGRRLYWLFVGVIGFVVGLSLGTQLFKTESELLILVIALTAGILGAALAVLFQRLAIAVAGFMAGGYLITALFKSFGFSVVMPSWLVFLIGGILGAILVLVLFDWALILLSSLTGTSLILTSVHVSQWVNIALWAGLCLVGIWLQASSLRRR